MEYLHLILLLAIVCCLPWLRRTYFDVPNIPAEKAAAAAGSRQTFFDAAKGLAILAVVTIHIADLYQTLLSAEHKPFLDYVISFSRFAIPFFLLSSGALLAPEISGWREYAQGLWKRFKRIGIPYVICCTVIAYCHDLNLGEMLTRTFNGEMAVPYYFVVLLFQLYIVYPFVASGRKADWFLSFCLILSLLALNDPRLRFIAGAVFFPRYLIFFAYGIKRREYYLADPGTFAQRYYWLVMVLLFAVLYPFFPDQYSNHQYVYGIALFHVLFEYRDVLRKHQLVNRALQFLGVRSLWIFLVHYAVLKELIPRLTYGQEYFLPHFIGLYAVCIAASIAAGLACHYAYDGAVKTVDLLRRALS